jgi:hypothetical protein
MVAKEYTERAGVYKVQTFGTTQGIDACEKLIKEKVRQGVVVGK